MRTKLVLISFTLIMNAFAGNLDYIIYAFDFSHNITIKRELLVPGIISDTLNLAPASCGGSYTYDTQPYPAGYLRAAYSGCFGVVQTYFFSRSNPCSTLIVSTIDVHGGMAFVSIRGSDVPIINVPQLINSDSIALFNSVLYLAPQVIVDSTLTAIETSLLSEQTILANLGKFKSIDIWLGTSQTNPSYSYFAIARVQEANMSVRYNQSNLRNLSVQLPQMRPKCNLLGQKVRLIESVFSINGFLHLK